MPEAPRKDATLSYAHAAPDRRRRLFRALLWFCLAGVIAVAAWKLAPEGVRRARMVYYQHRVLNAQPPDDPPYVALPSGPRVNADGTPAPPSPHRIQWYSSNEWFQFLLASHANPQRARSTIYVHSIADRHGNTLIIGVEILPGFEWETPTLNVQVIKPGGWFNDPSVASIVVRPFVFEFDLKSYRKETLTIYTGQPDPADSSHFTIDYELAGKRQTLDGYIDDQDVLTIQQRKELPSTRDGNR